MAEYPIPEDLKEHYQWALEEIHSARCDERPYNTAKSVRILIERIARLEAQIKIYEAPLPVYDTDDAELDQACASLKGTASWDIRNVFNAIVAARKERANA